jgi:hypothetical protein
MTSRRQRHLSRWADIHVGADRSTWHLPMKRIALVYVGIVFLGIAPLLVTFIAGSTAHAFGCRVDEASDHACMILGLDLGSLLSSLAILGWLAIVSIPVGAILLIGVTIFLAARKIRKRHATS